MYYEEEIGIVEEVAIVLFTKGMEHYEGTLLSETVGCAVLDSGCVKNVCSEIWLNAYLDTLDEVQRQSVTYESSRARFKFGDGSIYVSKYLVRIPANIAGKSLSIDTDVITNEIPLLLSKKAMKTADTWIKFQNDEVYMFGKKIKLITTTSGQ